MEGGNAMLQRGHLCHFRVQKCVGPGPGNGRLPSPQTNVLHSLWSQMNKGSKQRQIRLRAFIIHTQNKGQVYMYKFYPGKELHIDYLTSLT